MKRLPATLALTATLALGPLASALELTGPEVAKLDWNTRALQPADINGDGRTDLVVLNNDRAAIEILEQRAPGEPVRKVPGLSGSRWEPVLEDAAFRKITLSTGLTMHDLAVGDFNGDGRADLAYTGETQPLTLRYQRDDTWSEEVFTTAPEPLKYPSGLRAADLNGDGRADLVQLGQKEIALFLQKKDGGLYLAEKFPLSEENSYGVEPLDVDADGRVDLVYVAQTPREPLRVRRQDRSGSFGPEESFALKSISGLLQPIGAPKGGAAGAWFAHVIGPTGQVGFFRLARPEKREADAIGLHPRILSPRGGVRNASLHVFGDFDGEHGEDVAVADADGAQVHVYFRQPDGAFTTARAFPSLSEVRSAAAIAWEPKAAHSLVVASLKEAVFAELTPDREGRLGPPRTLPIPGRPLAVAAGPLDASGRAGLAALTEEGGRRSLSLWGRDDSGLVKLGALELPGLRTDPRDLRMADVNQDGFADFLVFVPREGVRLVLGRKDHALAEATALPAYRPGLLAKTDAPAVTTGDVDGDGRDELVVSAETFARAFRMKEDGELEIVAQFNARDSASEITAAFVVPARKGRPQVILHDRKGEQFHVLTADADGLYAVTSTRPAGRIEVTGAELRRGPKGRIELFLLGRDRLWWMPAGADDLELTTEGAYASDLPEVRYSYLLADNLAGRGSSEIMAVDTDKNLVEVLEHTGNDNEWRSLLHFKVFEVDTHYQGRRGSPQEPREAIAADVNADGKRDLVLLIHDRVLIYPQK